ncbi:Sir2 family NAD-dependent protein deacetylase [Psychrobacter sp. WY6]|uniref:Sir2 family NAD-dependent protein deacetylase n=1 Tax=Psychrobacter sp. WY6 TaxID=2708350 RepID=UPI0024DE105D|nr:Sir2 family NAD-dependent protein deacetylase [Psychrobacter sp. WY6]
MTSKQHICILTGAGISAESGIPTFRDKQTGLWENYGVEDLATPEAFTRDPTGVVMVSMAQAIGRR